MAWEESEEGPATVSWTLPMSRTSDREQHSDPTVDVPFDRTKQPRRVEERGWKGLSSQYVESGYSKLQPCAAALYYTSRSLVW